MVATILERGVRSGWFGARYLLGGTASSTERNLGAAELQRRRSLFSRMMAEADARDDCGVGSVWVPANAVEGRPAAVLGLGFMRLSLADRELDAWRSLSLALGILQPLVHIVVSPPAEEVVDPIRLVTIAAGVLDELGLGEHPQLLAAHADTDVLHVHCAVSVLHPLTRMPWRRFKDRFQLSKAVRKIELKHGLEPGRGDWVIDDRDSSIRTATREEKISWRQERVQEREQRAIERGDDIEHAR
jgi:hypothetical protein